MLENLGGSELLLIGLVIFIFFGPRSLPSLGRNVGKGVREFKRALRGIEDDLKNPPSNPSAMQ